jgi:tetratricopeptide (TPR) repeat protein
MTDVTANPGQQAYQQGDYAAAIVAFQDARDVARTTGDQHAEASALRDMGVALQQSGKLDEAQTAYDEALALFASLDDKEGRATVLGNQATLLRRRGKAEEAEAQLKQVADLFTELGNREYEVDTLRLLSQWQMKRGAWLDSLISYNQAMSRMPRLSPIQHFLRATSNLLLRVLGVRKG